jgi:heptosyltransferase-2
MKRILIIKLGAKGDVIRTLPVLIAIRERYPDSEITWITKPSCREILGTSPYISKIFTLPINLSEFAEEFDALFNFDIDEEASYLASTIKSRQKYGFFQKEGYLKTFNLPAEYYLNTFFDDDLKKTNSKTYQQMMFEIAELPYKKQHYAISLNKEDLDYAKNFVSSNNISSRIIGIHIGSSKRWPSKSWHVERVTEFVRKIKNKGYDVILFGGLDEAEKQKKLIRELEEKGIKIFSNNPSNTDIQFFALLNLCDKIVCGDSFALHASLALKKPTICLFFCTSPDEIEDYGLLKKIVSPALYNFFPEKQDQYNEELTKSISANQVLNALEDFEKTKKVVNAVIKDNNKILIVKRKEGIHAGKWAFPGGIVKDSETIGEALEREVKEETNLKINQIIKRVSDYSYFRPDGKKTAGISFLISVKENNVSINEEAEEFRWVSLEELNQLNCIEDLYEEAVTVFS